MDITTDELLAAFQECAAENAILRRRLAVKDQQIQELTQALNTRTMEDTPPGGVVAYDSTTGRVTRIPYEDQQPGAQRLADAVEPHGADGEPDGEAALRESYRLNDQVLMMHALSPDMTVRKKALAELLGREPNADELADPEGVIAEMRQAREDAPQS